MATLILKLVGYNPTNNNNDYIIKFPNITFKITDIYSNLIEKGMTYKELEEIRFICCGHNINEDHSKIYKVDVDEEMILYLFTNNHLIKKELIKNIFINQDANIMHKSEKESGISGSGSDIPDEIDIIVPERMQKINENIITLFNEPDFVNLLRICIDKPILLNLAAGYIMNGNITDEIKIVDIDDFKYESILIELNKILSTLNFKNITDIILKSVINHFDGHINLSLRYILNTYK